MALRLRRGTDAERLTITPEAGEPLYTTDTKQLYVGDGTTSGGILVGPITAIVDIVEDVTPQLGGNLDLNNNNIIGSGNINISGAITVNGTPIGAGTGDGVVAGSNYNINIIGDDSSIIVDSATNTVRGNFVGSVFADDSTTLVDSIAQVINAPGGLIGNLTGTVNGDLSGSVFADNSTLLVDGTNATLNLAVNSITDLGNVSIDVANVADIPDGSVLAFNGITKQFENAPLYLGGTNFDIVKGNFDGSFSGDVLGDDSTLLIDGFNKNASFFNLSVETVSSNIINVSNDQTRTLLGLSYSSDTGGSPGAGVLELARSRGNQESKLAVQDGDRIYEIKWSGYDGTNDVALAQIVARASGTVSSGIIPGRLDFSVADNTGNITRGLSIFPGPEIYLDGEVFTRGTQFNFDSSGNDAAGGYTVTHRRSRGSAGSPTAVQNQDEIFDLEFYAHDGNDYLNTANIKTTVDGAVSAGVVPSKLDIQVTSTNGVLQTALTIANDKQVTVTGDLAVNGVIEGTLIGSVYASDDSAVLIDASNGSLQIANVNVVGETGNTPSVGSGDLANVNSWLEVNVNGATRYIPLYA